MSEKMMPREIWINSAEFKLVDALRKNAPQALWSSKYHRDDKYRALEAENEKLRAALTTIKLHSPNDTDVRIASDALER